MKKFYFFVLAIGLLAFTTTDENIHFAKVEMVSGTPIFVFSKPVSEYAVVGKAMSFGEMLKMATDQKSSIREKTKKVVAIAQQRVKEEKIPDFDALIIELQNDKMHAIKFSSEVSQKAKVDNYNDTPIYFLSQPEEEYEVVQELKADYSLRAERNGMLFDKIKSMVSRTLKKRENKEVGQFDAIIVSPDNLSEKLIIFKKQ
jgi:DNA-binding response OmpR family regulator